MSENYQDSVSDSGRSIRRIPVSDRPKYRKTDDGGGVFGSSSGFASRRNSSGWGIWLIAIISIFILFFVFSLLFSGVNISVVPKQEAVFIDGNFTAFRNGQSGELSFEIMTLDRSLSGEVPATGEEYVEEKASGKIVVYNNYSNATQKLIKDTRFESPEGLIYRIKDAVVVPGTKVVNGETVPGSLEVTVYADKPGDKYNIGLTDFTIPGLKGDPRYSKFYARSKTEMTGGLMGNVRKASEEDIATITSDLNNKLRVQILEEASSVKPEGFLLLNDSYAVKIDSTTSNGTDGNVVVTQSATFYGIIFNENEFANFLAKTTIDKFDNSPVELNNTDNLQLSLSDPDSINSSVESLSFALKGETTLIWLYDESALLSDLAGMSKKDVSSLLHDKYPGIETARVSITPFWTRTITENTDKIELKKILK